MTNLNFDKINHYISYNKVMKGIDGNSVTISVNIPEMGDDQLVAEVKSICQTMRKCVLIIEGKTEKISMALAATSGAKSKMSEHDAARQFEKGFGVLCKLNNELVIRGLADSVKEEVQLTLGRKSGVESNLDNNEHLMLSE